MKVELNQRRISCNHRKTMNKFQCCFLSKIQIVSVKRCSVENETFFD